LVKDIERNELFCRADAKRGVLHFSKTLLIFAERAEFGILKKKKPNVEGMHPVNYSMIERSDTDNP